MQHAIKFGRPDAEREPERHQSWIEEFLRSDLGPTIEMPVVEEVYSIKPTRSERRTIVEYSERTRGKSWFVVTVGTWCEYRAQEDLDRAKIVTYLPLVTKKIIRRKKTVSVSVPWLRHYLFVALDSDKPEFGDVRDVRDVLDFIGVEGDPERIPGACIEAVVRREAIGKLEEIVRPAALHDWMKAGEIGRINDGPFASFFAEIIERRGGRLKVDVDIFGKVTPIDLEVAQFERV